MKAKEQVKDAKVEMERLSDEELFQRYSTEDPAMQDKPFILETFRRVMKLREEVDWLNKFNREHVKPKTPKRRTK